MSSPHHTAGLSLVLEIDILCPLEKHEMSDDVLSVRARSGQLLTNFLHIINIWPLAIYHLLGLRFTTMWYRPRPFQTIIGVGSPT